MAQYMTVVSIDQADYLEQSLGQGVLKRDTYIDEHTVRIALSESAMDYLSSIPSDSDGHIDADGVLWIGGTDYPLEVLRNA